MNPFRLSLLPAIVALSGCSLFNQDGIDDAPRHFTIPVYNSASEQPPYTRVMGNPMPDLAWSRERASECESWFPGANGCRTAPAHAAPATIARVAPQAPEKSTPYKGS